MSYWGYFPIKITIYLHSCQHSLGVGWIGITDGVWFAPGWGSPESPVLSKLTRNTHPVRRSKSTLGPNRGFRTVAADVLSWDPVCLSHVRSSLGKYWSLINLPHVYIPHYWKPTTPSWNMLRIHIVLDKLVKKVVLPGRFDCLTF